MIYTKNKESVNRLLKYYINNKFFKFRKTNLK